jgi:hypothetical protein
MRLGSDPPALLAFTPLERAVLRALALSLGDDGAVLLAQYDRARVVSRTHSGVGFVTKLEVPADVAEVPAEAVARSGPVHAHHPELSEPAEFLVQLKAGRLASIEAFCHQGTWPADDGAFRVVTAPR